MNNPDLNGMPCSFGRFNTSSCPFHFPARSKKPRIGGLIENGRFHSSSRKSSKLFESLVYPPYIVPLTLIVTTVCGATHSHPVPPRCALTPLPSLRPPPLKPCGSPGQNVRYSGNSLPPAAATVPAPCQYSSGVERPPMCSAHGFITTSSPHIPTTMITTHSTSFVRQPLRQPLIRPIFGSIFLELAVHDFNTTTATPCNEPAHFTSATARLRRSDCRGRNRRFPACR